MVGSTVWVPFVYSRKYESVLQCFYLLVFYFLFRFFTVLILFFVLARFLFSSTEYVPVRNNVFLFSWSFFVISGGRWGGG